MEKSSFTTIHKKRGKEWQRPFSGKREDLEGLVGEAEWAVSLRGFGVNLEKRLPIQRRKKLPREGGRNSQKVGRVVEQ